MIFDFLKKQKELNKKLKLVKIMILNLRIPDAQKSLYLQSLEILDEDGINNLYNKLIEFVEYIELKDIKDINKFNFLNIDGLKEDEAIEKQKDLNSFSFLINNL